MLPLLRLRETLDIVTEERRNPLSYFSRIGDPLLHVITPYVLDMKYESVTRVLTIPNVRFFMNHHQAGPLSNNLYLYTLNSGHQDGFTILDT